MTKSSDVSFYNEEHNSDSCDMGINSMIEFFKKISDYFWAKTRNNGSLTCSKHRVEHTGKNIYSVIIDLELYKLTKDKRYLRRIKDRVNRTIQNLIQDPDFGYWIFYPGRLGRWNMSNSVIDSGACIDGLSSFYLTCFNNLTAKEKEIIKDTIFKNSETYLKKAVVGKEITNQRLWGGTGLSVAYKIFKKETWKKSLLDSVEKSLGEMWEDGTFPYHSSWREKEIFEGIYDTTTYYHSRCIAFIYYILENIGEDISKYREKLIKSTDLLLAMYQPNGIKNINLESKRWYWNSSYEIASNAFDIYAFVKTYELTKNKIYIYYARKALNQILKHQLLDNGINSHLNQPQNNFQCRIFWNAHLAWLARIMDKLPLIFQNTDEVRESKYFENSSIMKYKNENYSCILRGKKKSINLMWGPAVGGGSMLYFGRKKDNWKNVFPVDFWQENAKCNFTFYVEENYFKNLLNFIIANKKEIRSKAYHSLVELRTPNFKSFFFLLFRLFIMIVKGARGIYTSHWATEPVFSKDNDNAIFETVPAKRNGEILKNVKIRREYIFENDKLIVNEKMFLENNSNKMKKIRYDKPSFVKDFKVKTDLKYKDDSAYVLFSAERSPCILEISYSLN